MKKVVSIFLSVILLSVTANAQTFDEWFKQKKTQIRYLVEQIGNLEAQLLLLKKGYEIAHGGWTTIEGISHGELDLHGVYFASLQNINPHIARYAQLTEILLDQHHVGKRTGDLLNEIQKQDEFTSDDVKFLGIVFQELQTQMTSTVEEFKSILTNGHLRMTDVGRIKRIKELQKLFFGQLADFRTMDSQITTLFLDRSLEQTELQSLEQLQAVK